MIAAADAPTGRADRKLLAVGEDCEMGTLRRSNLPDVLRAGDVLVANDAATIPASLTGIHEPSGAALEIRLAGRPTLRPHDVRRFMALAFGAGDWHTPTEQRPAPPALRAGDLLRLGPLTAKVIRGLGHPRLIGLGFVGDVADVWAGIATHGRPIQYAHVSEPLALWDVWTPVAAHPVAFEAPSAGFALSWAMLDRLEDRGVAFATLTHAAGISSTGDISLDERLPFDEPYHIPIETARRIRRARKDGGRVIAIGTTVVRALEHAARETGSVRAGPGTATQRIGHRTPIHVVDGILTGIHEAATSHYQLLRAFAGDSTLAAVDRATARDGYRNHEFGDSLLLMRSIGAGVGISC